MNIVLLGPPGSGKGTQTENLAKEFNLFKISTGELLREEISNNTHIWNKIKSIIEKGKLVPDELISTFVENILHKKKSYENLIFDGYPRNLKQAIHLDNLIKRLNKKISCVFNLSVSKNIIIKRITGRLVCTHCNLTFNEYFNPPANDKHKCDKKFLVKRSDDDVNTANDRFDTYTKETLPIIDYYKNQKLLYEIDGLSDISTIYKEIRQIITPLQTWL